MMPLLIGYSGGGMLVLRTLHELAGAFGTGFAVVDAVTGDALPRDIDRRSGRPAIVRPVLGLKVPYACALATGKLPRLLLGQWTMLAKLRSVPDTVDDFTGFITRVGRHRGHVSRAPSRMPRRARHACAT